MSVKREKEQKARDYEKLCVTVVVLLRSTSKQHRHYHLVGIWGT